MYRFSILLIFILPTLAHAPLYDSLGLARGKLAHQYHGIWFSVHDRTGDWFERDGKRCRLYTKGCEAYIARRLGG
jgi:hypothetical protein